MTQQEQNNVFKEKILPVMDKLHREHSGIGNDMFLTCVISELRKKNVPLDNILVNRIMDKMASYIVASGTMDYIGQKVYDNNIVKTVFDFFNEDAADTPLDKEIKRRADLMYDASPIEKAAASISTAATDVLATAPVAVLCPQSVAYGFLVQGGYDIVNETILLPEDENEKLAHANAAIADYNALAMKADANIIPSWMPGKYGITDYSTAPDEKLKEGKKWGEQCGKWWGDMHDQLEAKKAPDVVVNGGKKFSVYECWVKSMQYKRFAGKCGSELETREYVRKAQEEEAARLAKEQEEAEKAEAEAQAEREANEEKEDDSESNDIWGSLINGLGFNGLGNLFGRNFGYTLANLPDMILGVFTGKTKSTGFNADTMVPLACLFGSKFVGNPLLKVAMMGYGGLNLFNKLGQENLANAQQRELEQREGNASRQMQFKRYDDEELNPRISNPQINGNQMMADIDRVPSVITLPETTIAAYKAGALPLNTLANAVLAKNDLMVQQSMTASVEYEHQNRNEQRIGIR